MLKKVCRQAGLPALMVLGAAALVFQLYHYTPSAQAEPSRTAGAGTPGAVSTATAATGGNAARGRTAPAAASGAAAPARAAAEAPVAVAGTGGRDDLAVAAMPARLPLMGGQEIRAQLSPRRFATLATEIGARIQRLPVVESGRFRSGELLVSFDCSIQKAQLDRSRAEMEAAERILAANEQLDKFNSIGKLDLETSRSAFAKSKAEVAVAEATMGKCEIPAPYDGRIADLKVREQQYVQPGQPLMEILDDTTLELEFIVPSRWLSWLKPGLPFSVKIDETRRTYRAVFTRVGAKVDAASMTVKVAGQIEGAHSELMPGMSGVVMASPADVTGAGNKRRNPGASAERPAVAL